MSVCCIARERKEKSCLWKDPEKTARLVLNRSAPDGAGSQRRYRASPRTGKEQAQRLVLFKLAGGTGNQIERAGRTGLGVAGDGRYEALPGAQQSQSQLRGGGTRAHVAGLALEGCHRGGASNHRRQRRGLRAVRSEPGRAHNNPSPNSAAAVPAPM